LFSYTPKQLDITFYKMQLATLINTQIKLFYKIKAINFCFIYTFEKIIPHMIIKNAFL